MVSDPRITTLLSRLGGIYRDPRRVDRDASSLLKSSIGVHLVPGIAPLYEDNGDASNCLVLQGTIAIVFRGSTYQLLVDIYLPAGYPTRPPISYIRLANPNMYLKENHPHVGRDGMVYMPYTHEWNSRTHSLIEMVVAMSSIFSADPPVFTRTTRAPAPAPAPTPPPPPPPPRYQAPDEGYVGPGSTVQDSDSERFMAQQIALIAEQERKEKEKKEAELKQQIALQQQWEDKKKLERKAELCLKTQIYLTTFAEKTRSSLQADWRDQQHLEHNKELVTREMERLQETKDQLEEAIKAVDNKTVEIKEWLQEAQDGGGKNTEMHVDDMCQPVSKLHAQLLDLSAENAALDDALYFLDKAMYMGQMDCTTHLKSVRKLAKQQFRVRALLNKINQVLASNNTNKY